VKTAVASDKSALKKSLTIATAIMMGSVLLSRVIGLVREQVIAGFGGTSTEIDSYVTAFIIPELLNHFLAGGFLSITFIPIFQRYLSRDDAEGGWRSFSNLITIGTVAFVIVIPLAVIFTPEIYRMFGPHITGKAYNFNLTVRLTRIILPAQLLFYWGAFFSAVQMARHKFFFPALSPLFYNIGIIGGGMLLGPRLGIEGFAWGVLAGSFIANVLVLLPGAISLGLRYKPRFDFKHPDVKEFIIFSFPLIVGLGMTFSNELFFRYFSSFLGEGGTSSINYALRTMGIIVAVFGQASGVAFYPYLSKLAIEKKFDEITSLLNRVLTKIGLYCIPVSLLLMVLAPQVISILYQHGRFTSASTALTAPVFALYMAGAFAFAAAIFVVRPFYAVQRPYIPMAISTAISLCSLPVYYLTSKQWGASGIAASAVCGMTLQFLALYLFWSLRYGDRGKLLAMVKTFALIVGASVVAIICGWFVRGAVAKHHFGFGRVVDDLIICTITTLPVAAIVLTVYEMTGLQKINDLVQFARRKTH
jgi:putative peptidoglycan lipid II flippase